MILKEQEYFKDVCMHIPHNTLCEILNYKRDYVGKRFLTIKGFYIMDNEYYFNFHNGRSYAGKNVKDFKLLLTPLSNMTEEHCNEAYNITTGLSDGFVYYFNGCFLDWLKKEEISSLTFDKALLLQDFLLSKGYDIKNLIGRGYALVNDSSMDNKVDVK